MLFRSTPGYQWQEDKGAGTFTTIIDNGNYAGSTTDTLTVSNAPFSWNGYRYRCIVTSVTPCTASATSDTSVLTINPTPVVTLTAAPYTKLLPGLSTTVTAGSTPAAVSYSWYKNDVAIPTATTSSVTVTIDGLGLYTAAVVDVNGCTNTSDGFEITDSVSTKLFVFPNPNNGQFQVRY